MGDNLIYSYCNYSRTVKDCDGDIVIMCGFSGKCPYKNVVRDCDGDYIETCTQ